MGRLVAAGRALAHHLDRTDAELVLEAALVAAKPYADVHDEPVWTTERLRDRLPWRHVDRVRLADAVEQLPTLRAKAGLVPAMYEAGPCCWCGVVESTGWEEFGHRWQDGTEGGLCGPCGTVYLRSGSPDPAWWEAQRAAIAEACSGVPWPMGQTPPAGLLAFAETVGDGTGEPWSHLPIQALDAFRWTSWATYGGRYAPPEHRAEALARARAADAAKAARRASLEAEQAARNDVYGFGQGVA